MAVFQRQEKPVQRPQVLSGSAYLREVPSGTTDFKSDDLVQPGGTAGVGLGGASGFWS